VGARHDVAAELVENKISRWLHEQLGATYGFSAHVTVMRGSAAYLNIVGAVESGKLAPALVALRDTLNGFADAPAPDNDLAWAKVRRAQDHGTSFMTNHAIVARLLGSRNVGYRIDGIDRYASDLSAVSVDAVQQDFQYCKVGRPTLSIVGDWASVHVALKQAYP
jgi:hypothetical protein